MSETSSNNKRIAKNTFLLYVRMLFIMAVQLYTSRVVLNTLGVIDYGIYNAVGGIVTMFAFLNGAMIASSQRYITFELGRGDFERLRQVFNASVHIHSLISIFLVVVGETIGLWFLYEKMVIPEGRMTAALWVFHLSVVTMVVQIMSVPYNSAIIAHEKMSAFAIISILEVILKLLVVYLLLIGKADKLILYAIMIAMIQLLIRFVYARYCHVHFGECHTLWHINRELIKEMGAFAGWNVWGNLAAALFGSGLNLLLNVFFGPVVNAARAIALQVETAIAQFSTNFLMAVNPQITKLYAQRNVTEMHKLLFRSSKFTFFLLLALSLPVIIESKTILILWLGVVPEYTIQFLSLMLFIAIIDATARPLMTAAAATGRVKVYQSVIGGILLLIVPVAYIVLKMGGDPLSVYIVHLIIGIIAFAVRLIIIKPMILMSIREYFKDVIRPCLFCSILSFSISYAFHMLVPSCNIWAFTSVAFSFLLTCVVIYSVGLNHNERSFVFDKIKSIVKKSNGNG